MANKKGRYWIFAYDGYYPLGGLNDFQFSFNTEEDFEESILGLSRFDSYQLLDTRTNYSFQGDLGTVTKWICKNIGDERYEEGV